MTQRIFGAGSMYAVGLTTANGAAIANPTPVEFGTLQDLQIDIKDDVKQLYGKFRDAVAVGKGKRTVTWKAKNANINGALLNVLLFGKGSYDLQDIQYKIYKDATPSPIPLAAFAAPTVSEQATTGGTFLAGNHFFTIVAYNAVGSALAKSTQSTVLATTTGTSKVTVTWARVTGAVKYRIFYTQTSGVYTKVSSFVTDGSSWDAGATFTGTLIAPPATTATIPTLTPYIILATGVTGEAGTVTFRKDLGVTDTVGRTYTRVAASPAVDQYSLNETTGEYTFNVADAGAQVYIDFEYSIAKTGAIVTTGGAVFMGQQPTFEIRVQTTDENGRQATITLPFCVADSLNLATKLDDFSILGFSGIAYGKDGQDSIRVSLEAQEGFL